MKATLRALLWGESGQDLIEYSLLGALLSVVSILALQGLGGVIRNDFRMIYLHLLKV